jgi:hypothetical protein
MGVMQRLAQGLVVVGVSLSGMTWAQELPRLVQQEGRTTLLVDGKPYFMLGHRWTIRAAGRSGCVKCGRRWNGCD